jgi:hypothetical protein
MVQGSSPGGDPSKTQLKRELQTNILNIEKVDTHFGYA